MMTLEAWLNSGLYVFVVLSEDGYQQSSLALESWPDAVVYGDYRLVNLDKCKAQFFYDYAIDKGFNPTFGISDGTPMLLTWNEAREFAAQFAVEETTTP
jgi:hypothetical protein